MAGRIPVGVLVVRLLLPLFCGTAAQAVAGRRVFSFEGRTLPRLTRYNGATASLSHAAEARHGTRSVELTFGFPRDTSYAGLMFAEELEQVPTRFSFDLHGDGNGNLLCLRFTDAEGETFQLRLGVIGWHGWQRRSSDLARLGSESHWGGDDDGVVDLPLRGFGIEIRNYAPYGSCRKQGRLLLDHLVVESAASPSPTVPGEVPVARCPSGPASTDEGPFPGVASAAPIRLAAADTTADQATVWLSVSRDTLHIAAEVRDDQVMPPTRRHDPTDGDALELWFDTKANSSPDGFGQPDDCLIALHPGPDDATLSAWYSPRVTHVLAASRVRSRPSERGYRIEATVPLAALPGFVRGTVVGFDACWWDSDGGEGRRMSWAGGRPGDPWGFGLLCVGAVPETELAASRAGLASRRQAWLEALAPPARVRPGPPSVRSLRIVGQSGRIPRFGFVELACEVSAEYDNPFDPDDILVQVLLSCPSGDVAVVDAFWYQPYRYRTGQATEVLTPVDEPHWRARFTPTSPGEHTCVVRVRDRAGRVDSSESVAFSCVPSERDGFIRRSARDPRYLEFDSGRAFLGIGFASHFWKPTHVVLAHKHYLGQLAAFGGNTTSVNMETAAAGAFSLETGAALGRYNLENAAKFDLVLEAARRRGVYLIPCLTQTALADAKHFGISRFNAARGGPCKTADEFFSSPEAVRLVRQRLRYSLARWGYSPNVLAWELFNEVNYTAGYRADPEAVRNWHAGMAAFLKQHDPNDHLVTTCFGSSASLEDAAIWGLPQIDAVVTHQYGKDLVPALRERLRLKRAFGKPNIGGETGHSWPEADRADLLDPDGVSLHNTLWTSMAGGSATTVMHWWPFRYIDAGDHYHLFRPLAEFVRDIDWPAQGFVDIDPEVRPTGGEGGLDLQLAVSLDWGPRDDDLYCLDAGQLWVVPERVDTSGIPREADADTRRRVGNLPGVLFGKATPGLACRLRLKLTLADPCEVSIGLRAVSTAGATLTVSRGDELLEAARIVDSDAADNPFAEELRHDMTVALPAGESVLRLENAGEGWLSLRQITVRGGGGPGQVMAFGLLGRTLTVLWLHDRRNSWTNRSEGYEPARMADTELVLPDFPARRCQVEWWSTTEGTVVARAAGRRRRGTLLLYPPPFCGDIACKVRY